LLIKQSWNNNEMIRRRLAGRLVGRLEIPEMRYVHQERPEKFRLLWHFSLRYLAKNDFEAAFRLLDMNDFQSDIARQMARSNLYVAAGKYGSAISCYMKDIMTDPWRRQEWWSASEGLITALAKPLDSKDQSTDDSGNGLNGYRFLIPLNDGRLPLSGLEDDIHSIKTWLTRRTAFAYRRRPTDMHFAAWTGNVSVVEELIHTGIDVNIKDPIRHYTPLSLAVWNMHGDVIDLLLNVPTIELDIANSPEGWTSLHLAAWNNDVNTIEKLSIAGANLLAKDMTGGTPMLRAATWGNIEALRALKAAGAGSDRSDIIATQTIEAARRGHVRAIKALIEAEVDVSASNREGWTALRMAAVYGHVDVVKALLEAGADASSQGRDGRTAIHFASEKGHVDVVKALLEAGGDVSVQDKDGETALHLGAFREHIHVVKVLVEGGADVSVRSARGWTPLDYALGHYWRSNPCIKILEKAGAKRSVEIAYI
jgi:ankyrin repeat protein